MELTYTPSYRAKLIKQYTGRIPSTGEGIQTGYYRPDMLPSEPPEEPKLLEDGNKPKTNEAESTDSSSLQVLGQEESAQTSRLAPAKKNDAHGFAASARFDMSGSEDPVAAALRAAYVELIFDHGYPAMPTGMPFWHKFDFESGFAFAAFQMYLEYGAEGPRELYVLAQNAELLRVFGAQSEREVTPTELLFRLQEYYILHYWHGRTKAYDLYRDTALRHHRLKKQARTEDRHFGVADKILEKLMTYFDSEGFMSEMTPKAALDAFSKIVAIQRVSLGLPAGGPLPVNQQPEATSFEMIMRTVAQQQGAGQEVLGGGFGAATAHTREMINQVLTDPTAAKNLQEVIIRISQVSSGAEPTPERRFPGRPDMHGIIDEAQIIEAEVRDLNATPGA